VVTAGEKWVRVEVAPETLRRLLTAGLVCAADFRCLDCDSNECVRRLCLATCLRKPALWSKPLRRKDRGSGVGSPDRGAGIRAHR
jgi:hypothetical protein